MGGVYRRNFKAYAMNLMTEWSDVIGWSKIKTSLSYASN